MDEQAALESLLSVMMAKFSGANLIHDIGYMESGLTFSFEMVVLTDELIALSDNLMKGIEINKDTLMLDEIHNIGPGGHFLNTKQTLNRFKDFWYPSLLDRSLRTTWLDEGATTLGERLNKRVKEIVKEHVPEPLNADVKKKINEILSQAK
jgi:trimethylamine--corrinoid protein Co-methyltransferase